MTGPAVRGADARAQSAPADDWFGGRVPSLLVLADGEVFEGEAIGAVPPGGVATGELVFNTVLSGYQEVVTDPSYAGQVVAFTYPHIGNYGVTVEDDEAPHPWCRGVVVRDLPRGPPRGGRPPRSRSSSQPARCPGSRASTPAVSPGTYVSTGPWAAPSAPRPSRSCARRRRRSRARPGATW